MVGPGRPQFVLFGSSIVQFSYSNGGWGATLADLYARKVILSINEYNLLPSPPARSDLSFRSDDICDFTLSSGNGF